MADRPPKAHLLSVWEKLDILPASFSILGSLLYNSIAGLFRGKSGTKEYSLHVFHSVVRRMLVRMSLRQLQYLNRSTGHTYTDFMKKKGLPAETVSLEHGAVGHWIGNKNAKMVVVYYHGGGFAMPASVGHLEFYTSIVQALNNDGHDVALLLLGYTLTPHAAYPTQLRQAVECLRYALASTSRSPSNVIIGGDSAGGNLAMAVLLHLSHPHPDIKPIELTAPLGGVFAIAPWINFDLTGPSMKRNQWKDLISTPALARWSSAYLDGRPGDSWSEPARAPTEWWKGAKAEHVFICAGADEILLSGIQEFMGRFKTVVPNTTFYIAEDETHVPIIFSAMIGGPEPRQGREFREWLEARP